MPEYIYHVIQDDIYEGILTFLDYEADTRRCLSLLPVNPNTDKKILMDSALKTGMTEYRFTEFNTHNSTVDINSGTYAHPDKDLIGLADSYLAEHPDILEYSILTDSQKARLLGQNTD